MVAINVVRFRVKPGQEQRFIDYHRTAKPKIKGFVGGWIVKTGESSFCFVGDGGISRASRARVRR